MSDLSPRTPTPFARFEGAKTSEPILARNRGVLDALIIAALDPTVRAIAPATPIMILLDGSPVPHQPDFRLLTDTGPVVVDVYRPARMATHRERFDIVTEALADLGIRYERRDPPPIHGSPLLMNARSVWGCRRAQVAASDQVRVLDAVRVGPVSLAEAAQAVRSGDGVSIVLALACRDLVELDLAAGPLGPETQVRRRRVMSAADLEGSN